MGMKKSAPPLQGDCHWFDPSIAHYFKQPATTGLIAFGGEAIFLDCYLGVLQIVLQTVLAAKVGMWAKPPGHHRKSPFFKVVLLP